MDDIGDPCSSLFSSLFVAFCRLIADNNGNCLRENDKKEKKYVNGTHEKWDSARLLLRINDANDVAARMEK